MLKRNLMKNRRNSRTALVLLMVVLVFAGCKISKPKGVLSESQMETLLYDYHLAKAMSDNVPYSENYKKRMYMNYVFEKNNTTEEIFDSSLVWYTRHSEVLSKIYERVNLRLKEEQKEIDRLVAIRERKPRTSAPGDSIDLWFMRRMYRLDDNVFNNKVSFTIPSDSNFQDKDTLQWSVFYRHLGEEHQLDSSATLAFMAMAIRYTKNDSILSETRRIYEPGMQTIQLQADSLGAIKEIRGFIYYTGTGDSQKRPLFVDSISLMRYHAVDSIMPATTDSAEVENTLPEEQETPVAVEEILEAPVPLPENQERRLNPNDLRNRNRGAQPEVIKELER